MTNMPPTPDDRIPEPIRSQIMAMMAYRDLQTERARADRMLEDSNKLYDLRGWLRLCEDNPAGHTEFYRWSCHIIFGDEAPIEAPPEQPKTVAALIDSTNKPAPKEQA